jgi:hypothetical protein
MVEFRFFSNRNSSARSWSRDRLFDARRLLFLALYMQDILATRRWRRGSGSCLDPTIVAGAPPRRLADRFGRAG